MSTGSFTTSSGSLGVDTSGPQTTGLTDTVNTSVYRNHTIFSDDLRNSSDLLNESGLQPTKVNDTTVLISTRVEQLEHLAVIYMCILGVLVILANCIVLAISKFATGGKSATLIYVRSLCCADCLAGLYAVVKTIFFYVKVDHRLVNCFLGECLFFTSLMASLFTLALLTADCFFRLLYPLSFQNYMDKKLVIIYMIFLWNFSFIIGFCPLNGWNNDDYQNDLSWSLDRCMFFHYYPSAYFIMVTTIFVSCIVLMFGAHIKISLVANRKEWWAKCFGRQRSDLKKTMKVVNLIRMDMIASCIFYSPFFIYTLLYCNKCILHNNDADALYLFFIPYMLIKSLLNAMIHGGQTSQFKQVLGRFVRLDTLSTLGGSTRSANVSQQENIPSVDAALQSQNSRMKVDSSSVTLDGMVLLGIEPNFRLKNRHQPLKMQASNSTVLTSDSLDSDNWQNRHQTVKWQVSNSTELSTLSGDSEINTPPQHLLENQEIPNAVSTDSSQKELKGITLNPTNLSCVSKNRSNSHGLPKHPPLRRTKSADYSYKNGRFVPNSTRIDAFHQPGKNKQSRYCPVHGYFNSGYVPELLPVHLERKQLESRLGDDVPDLNVAETSTNPVVVAVKDEITAL